MGNQDGYQIFLSHPASRTEMAESIAREFARLGLTGFVANRDVPPANDWRQMLEDALLSCDALVALLDESFKASDWCDQEVGFALGLRKPVVPVRTTTNPRTPHGFLAAMQALDASTTPPRETANRIFDLLYDEHSQRSKLVPIAIQALATERTVENVRIWAGRLARAAPSLTEQQHAAIQRTLRANSVLRTDRIAYSVLRTTIPSG
jgi:hypothetical protein